METDQVGFVFGHREYRIRPNLVCWLPSSGQIIIVLQWLVCNIEPRTSSNRIIAQIAHLPKEGNLLLRGWIGTVGDLFNVQLRIGWEI